METTEKKELTIQTTIEANVKEVWEMWTGPEHIVRWNQANEDWHTTFAENDLQEGGRFMSQMEAKDGSFGFEFSGRYDQIIPYKLIKYTLDDDRKVLINFEAYGDHTEVVQTFEPESENAIAIQRTGWQAILDNFKTYVEKRGTLGLLKFDIEINAPVTKVYIRMFNKADYEHWSSAFCDTSTFEGSWEKGAKILFIGTDDKGEKGGMVSKIRENIPNRYVSIQHLGILHGDTEITEGPEVDAWANALENYTFESKVGKTLVKVDMDTNPEFTSYFEETYPKALQKLKELIES